MSEPVTINIPLKSGGSVTVSLEDARELRDKLNEIFGRELPQAVYPIPPAPEIFCKTPDDDVPF